MRRVVITGMGIWSSIGQDLQSVTESLRHGRSGVIYDQSRVDYGYQSGLVGNVPKPDMKPFLPRERRLLLSNDAEYAYMVTRQAFEQAGVSDEYLQHEEVGLIWGSVINSHQQEYSRIMEEMHCSALLGYNAVFRSDVASAVINLSSIFNLRGVNMTINAACASSSQAIGVASLYIKEGLQDMILVGGSSEIVNENVNHIVVDSTIRDIRYNKFPTEASRPFDREVVGEILSGGGAALVIEEYEHAKARGANILAEIVGYGFASGVKGRIPWVPSVEAEIESLKRALKSANLQPNDIDYIHSYATSGPIGDAIEANALQQIFGEYNTPISSTDAITGHEGGMAGASGIIYSILMMQNGFIAPNINLENPIEEAKGLNIIRSTMLCKPEIIISSASGIAGIQTAIIVKKI